MRVQDSDPHIEYYIRELDRDFRGMPIPRFPVHEYYEIAKFTGKRVPETVYQIEMTATGRHLCNCQKFMYSSKCKHVEMILNFKNLGKPATFPQFEILESL